MKINTQPNSLIYLESGDYFYGNFCGAEKPFKGELCFTTAMTGYQEAISDPSYAGQLLVFSFPHIGIVGTNKEDDESSLPLVNGIILNTLENFSSNFRAEEAFNSWLKRKNISGICNVDTRAIIRILRESSEPLRAFVEPYELAQSSLNEEKAYSYIKGVKFIQTLTTSDRKEFCREKEFQEIQKHQLSDVFLNIAVVDFGVKKGILNSLIKRNSKVFIFSPETPIKKLEALRPDGIVFSNGPGDPLFFFEKYKNFISKLIELDIPILGICMGYQLLALHFGAKTFQLPHAHHGINHPVKDIMTGKIHITSQNHEFGVDPDSLPECMQITHLSLFDNTLEGFKVRGRDIYAVQFHPEGNPGPQDNEEIFDMFLNECANKCQKEQILKAS